MSDEVNLENLDQLPDAADDQSQVDVQAMTFSVQEPTDAALADAQGEIDAVAAASPSEDIAEGMAYDSVEAADSTSADDAREAAQDSLQDSIDDSPEGDQAAKSEGTVDADANNDGPAAQADEAEEEAADAGALAVKEFSKSLRTLEGKWYVLHTYSGYEKRVKSNIESRVASFGLEDTIFQVEVPMEEVEKHTEKGKKVITRVRVPGYVLIRMWPDEDARRIVRETEGVTGFVGPTREPAPLTRKEVVAMMAPMIASEALKKAGDKPAAAKKRVMEVSYAVGDQVTVTDGPFATMSAVVSDVEPRRRSSPCSSRSSAATRRSSSASSRSKSSPDSLRENRPCTTAGFVLRAGPTSPARMAYWKSCVRTRATNHQLRKVRGGPVPFVPLQRKKNHIMAPKKKVSALIKLQIEAGKANPAPPLGPALVRTA